MHVGDVEDATRVYTSCSFAFVLGSAAGGRDSQRRTEKNIEYLLSTEVVLKLGEEKPRKARTSGCVFYSRDRARV